jgi:hypothetical protein
MEINQYPLESLTFQDDDFYDIDFWTGSGYQTKKIKGSVIKAAIAASVDTLYSADGTLETDRTVNLDTQRLVFNDGSVGINVTPFTALHVNAKAIPQGEAVARFGVTDSSGYAQIANGTGSNNVFAPLLQGKQVGTSLHSAIGTEGIIDPVDDIGTAPITLFKARLSSFASPVTRPLFQFTSWTFNVMTMLANGNVGIGTSTPTEKLEVDGKTKTSDFQMTNTPVAGYVLTSDVDGNGLWGAVPNPSLAESSKREVVEFINKTGAPILEGTIVYLKSTSSSGTHPEVELADASTEATSSKTIGAIYETTANDAIGLIVTSGEVDNLDTSMYSIGDRLWLSTTAGQVTTTPPTAPDHAVFIGIVTRSQNGNGRILYAIQNGYELREIHDVSIPTTPNDGDVLTYNSVTGLWEAEAVVGSNIYNTDGTLTGSRVVSLVNNDLTFSGSGSERFIVSIDDGTNAVVIDAANAFGVALSASSSGGASLLQITTAGININGQYTLPDTDGTSGQVVTTDGAGNLSFTTIGSSTPFIPSCESTEIRRGLIPLSGTTTVGTYGALTPVQTGSAVAVNFGGTTRLPKLRLLTTTGATNSTVGIGFGTSGLVNTIIFGFRFVGTYIYTDQSAGGTEWFVPGARQFCGLAAQSTILAINSGTTVESQVNIIGLGSDAADTNLQIFHNDATGAATKIDLGVSFPANKIGAVPNGAGYQLELYCAWGSTSVKYRVTKLSDNTIVTGTISTNLPGVTTPLGPQVVRTSGSTSQNVSIDVIQLTASTLY